MIKSTPYYLIITPFFPSIESFRGPFIYDQVKAINKLDQYKTIVLKPTPWYSNEKDYDFEGIKVYRFRTYELPSAILPGLFDFLSVYSLIRKLKAIGVPLENIDVAHSHVASLGFLAKGLKKINNKIKSIVQHHGFDVLSLENGRLGNKKWHQRWVENYGSKVCNDIDLHVAVSQKTLSYLQSFSKIKIKESYVLYNGVDYTKFYPISNNKKSKEFFTIGCVANFWTLKDQITLLKAFNHLVYENELSNFRLKFVGTGETLKECRAFVQNHRLEQLVEFTDTIEHSQLIYFYNSLDLFVLPSYWEAFGCVYLEAHACGVPFIAVKDQGISEIIKPLHAQRQLINKSDSIALQDNILFYYQNKKYFPDLMVNYNINNLVHEFMTTITKKKKN